MSKVGHLFFIKVSPLFIGVVLLIIVLLGIFIYKKKRKSNS